MRAVASISRAGRSWSPVLIVSWAQAIAYKAAVWIVPIFPSLYGCIACLELSKRIQRLTLSLQMGRLRLRERFWTAQHREAEGGLGTEPSLPWSGANAAGTRPNHSPEGGWGTEGESGQTWHCWWEQTPRARWHLFQYSDPCRLGRFRTTDLLVTFLFFLVQLRCLKQWKNCYFIWHHEYAVIYHQQCCFAWRIISFLKLTILDYCKAEERSRRGVVQLLPYKASYGQSYCDVIVPLSQGCPRRWVGAFASNSP